ncbi:MAG: methyltransferase domain-containing protein [Bdellovibrionota bacterium]
MTAAGPLAHSFSRSAATYHTHAAVQRRIAERLMHFISPELEPKAIVDLGAGTGFLTEALARRFPDALIDAVDISPGMVEQCRCTVAEYPTVRVLISDARELEGTARYDLIASSSALQWMSPITRSLTHFRNLLTPGGLFVAAVMLSGTLEELRILRNDIAPGKQGTALLPTAGTLKESASDSGFQILSFARDHYRQAFTDAGAMLAHISALGTSGPVDVGGGKLLTRSELNALQDAYNRKFRVEENGTVAVHATYEVGFLVARRG